MATVRDPTGQTTGAPYYRRRSTWGWGTLAVLIAIALIVWFAVDWAAEVPTTGAVPPAPVAPTAAAPAPAVPAPAQPVPPAPPLPVPQ